jgi:hypothetical protein
MRKNYLFVRTVSKRAAGISPSKKTVMVQFPCTSAKKTLKPRADSANARMEFRLHASAARCRVMADSIQRVGRALDRIFSQLR